MKTNHALLYTSFNSFLPSRLTFKGEKPKKNYDTLLKAAMDTSGRTEKGWFNPEKAEKENRAALEKLKTQVEEEQADLRQSPQYQAKEEAWKKTQGKIESGELEEDFFPEGYPKTYDRNKDKHLVTVDVYNTYELFPHWAKFKIDGKQYVGEYLGLWDKGEFSPTLDADGEPIPARDSEGKVIRVAHGLATQMRRKHWEGRRPLRIWEEQESGVRLWKKKELQFYSQAEANAYKRGPYLPMQYTADNGETYWVLGENGEPVRNKEGKVIGAFIEGRTFNDLTPEEAENYGIVPKVPAGQRGQYELRVEPGTPYDDLSHLPEYDTNSPKNKERIEDYEHDYRSLSLYRVVRPKEAAITDISPEERQRAYEKAYASPEDSAEAISVTLEKLDEKGLEAVKAFWNKWGEAFKPENIPEILNDLANLPSQMAPEDADWPAPETEEEKANIIAGWWKIGMDSMGPYISEEHAGSGEDKRNPFTEAYGYIDYYNPAEEDVYLLLRMFAFKAYPTAHPAVFEDNNLTLRWPKAEQKAKAEIRTEDADNPATRMYHAEMIINGYNPPMLPRVYHGKDIEYMDSALDSAGHAHVEKQMGYPIGTEINYEGNYRRVEKMTPEQQLLAEFLMIDRMKVIDRREAEYNATGPVLTQKKTSKQKAAQKKRIKLLIKYRKQNEERGGPYSKKALEISNKGADALSEEDRSYMRNQIDNFKYKQYTKRYKEDLRREEDPKNKWTHHASYAHNMLELGRNKEALRAFREALGAIDPEDPHADDIQGFVDALEAGKILDRTGEWNPYPLGTITNGDLETYYNTGELSEELQEKLNEYDQFIEGDSTLKGMSREGVYKNLVREELEKRYYHFERNQEYNDEVKEAYLKTKFAKMSNEELVKTYGHLAIEGKNQVRETDSIHDRVVKEEFAYRGIVLPERAPAGQATASKFTDDEQVFMDYERRKRPYGGIPEEN